MTTEPKDPPPATAPQEAPSDDAPHAVTGQLLGMETTDPGAPAPDAVPAAFVAVQPKKDRPPESKGLDPKSLEALKNRMVEVYANGVTYRGILQGSDGEEIYLRGELRYVTVAMERVARLVPLDVKPAPLSTGIVDPTFYEALQGVDEDDGKKDPS
jgi:hypothetical protein